MRARARLCAPPWPRRGGRGTVHARRRPSAPRRAAAADMQSMGWELGKELGSGHFAKVKLVTRKSDGQQAACKIIKKPKGAPRPPPARARPSGGA